MSSNKFLLRVERYSIFIVDCLEYSRNEFEIQVKKQCMRNEGYGTHRAVIEGVKPR